MTRSLLPAQLDALSERAKLASIEFDIALAADDHELMDHWMRVSRQISRDRVRLLEQHGYA